MIKGIKQGIGIFVGLCLSSILAYTVSGSIKTWTSGETLTATDLNTTVQSLKTALESASQITSTYAQPHSGTVYANVLNDSDAVETNIQFAMPRAGIVKNVLVHVASNTCTATSTLVLRNNGVDTAITYSVGAGVTVLSLTSVAGTLAFAAGDKLTWKGTCSSGFVNFGITHEF